MVFSVLLNPEFAAEVPQNDANFGFEGPE